MGSGRVWRVWRHDDGSARFDHWRLWRHADSRVWRVWWHADGSANFDNGGCLVTGDTHTFKNGAPEPPQGLLHRCPMTTAGYGGYGGMTMAAPVSTIGGYGAMPTAGYGGYGGMPMAAPISTMGADL